MRPSEQKTQYTRTGFYPPRTYLLIDDLYIERKEGDDNEGSPRNPGDTADTAPCEPRSWM